LACVLKLGVASLIPDVPLPEELALWPVVAFPRNEGVVWAWPAVSLAKTAATARETNPTNFHR
jgi:hypothetical protein